MLPTLIAGVAAALIAGGAYFSPQLVRLSQVRRLRRTCARKRTIVLTYDDGPGPELTPRLLTLLAEFGARATFFPLGRRAADHPDVVDRVASAGHELACHSHDHLHAWRVAPWQAVRDIDAGYRTLQPWVPLAGLYRPPCGKMTLATWWVIRRRGADFAWWTVDSGDTHVTLPRTEAVVAAVREAGGGIVLLHDFDRGSQTRAARHAHVLNTTAQLLEMARLDGLTVCTFSQLLRLDADTTCS